MTARSATTTGPTLRRAGPIALGSLIVVVVLATVAPIALGVPVEAPLAIGSKVVLCALAVVLLSANGWWRRAGFLALPARADLVWLGPPTLLIMGVLAAVVVAGPVPVEASLIVAFVVVALGTGFSEEALFRGVLVESIRPWGPLRAIVGSTAAFSAIHFAGLLAGATLEATIVQVVLGGIPFGLAFAGLRLTTRSIWPLVALHAVNNVSAYLMSGQWQATTAEAGRFGVAATLQLGLLVLLVAYGVWFLWHFSRSQRVAPLGEP